LTVSSLDQQPSWRAKILTLSIGFKIRLDVPPQGSTTSICPHQQKWNHEVAYRSPASIGCVT